MMAAYTAAKGGLRVKLIAKGLGAIHWNAGTIDVLGYYPDEKTLVEYPLEAIQTFAETNPQHPYALLGSQVPDTLNEFVALTQELGLPYFARSDAANWLLPSPVGAVRPTFLAPQDQIGGDLMRKEPMLIVGLRGMRDFYPDLIAENLRKQGYTARAAYLPLGLITERHDINTAQMASALDDPARHTALAVALKKLVQPGERIGVPAILGMDKHREVVVKLQSHIGAEVFEIPTLPPSVPGIRLNTALRRHLDKLGVRVEINMEVCGHSAESDRLLYVETATSARPLKHHAERFLLATGGVLGGGINTDHSGRAWETVLNLPLTISPRRDEWFRARFFDPAGQPVFRGGVLVNRDLQPTNAADMRVLSNVWAAGGILGHADPVLERSLEGIAITTGIMAARKINQS